MLAGCPGKEGGHHVGGVAVQRHPGAVITHGGPWVRVEAASCTSRSGTPASKAAVMKACLKVCGPTGLVMPARQLPGARCGPRRGGRGAPRRGPGKRAFAPFADGEIHRPGRRGASGTVTTLPPLRRMVRVRWPRSNPSASMLAPVASETREPVQCQQGNEGVLGAGPRPAATSRAPTSLRSRAVACDSSSTRGRRTCTAGECSRSSSSTA